MANQQYQNATLIELYDQLNPIARDSAYFISACAPTQHSVLDLGCGTGLLTAALAARGHRTVGVDPSEGMLAIARSRITQPAVNWICTDARELDLQRPFDRVIASGHVFQVFLTPSDQMAFLKTAAHHLAPEGNLIFDSRNPASSPWLDWIPEHSKRRVEHPLHGPVDVWNTVTAIDHGFVKFTTSYYFVLQGRKLTNESQLAFPTRLEIEDRLQQAGLEIVALHGDWDGSEFLPSAKEMIVTARLARNQM